ncbi:hypothetical protein DESA109040_05425 [Deinococcus saxicola]|uniref:hypothetical protein n=1 Tax=Deinococcus saxicola TaxID=249406 RepID=UPI0039EF8D73
MAFLVAGWLLGWLAVGDRRWAVLTALATLLAVLGEYFSSLLLIFLALPLI